VRVALWDGKHKHTTAEFMKEAAKNSIDEIAANHYSIPKGRVNLRKAISKHYSESFNLNRALDYESEIVISSGMCPSSSSSSSSFSDLIN
jgi:kynurenine aminotransferase